MPSNHLILWRPLLFLSSSFPALGSFPMSQLFASGGQNTGVYVCLKIIFSLLKLHFLNFIYLVKSHNTKFIILTLFFSF